jgi:hypothetical protein
MFGLYADFNFRSEKEMVSGVRGSIFNADLASAVIQPIRPRCLPNRQHADRYSRILGKSITRTNPF